MKMWDIQHCRRWTQKHKRNTYHLPALPIHQDCRCHNAWHTARLCWNFPERSSDLSCNALSELSCSRRLEETEGGRNPTSCRNSRSNGSVLPPSPAGTQGLQRGVRRGKKTTSCCCSMRSSLSSTEYIMHLNTCGICVVLLILLIFGLACHLVGIERMSARAQFGRFVRH